MPIVPSGAEILASSSATSVPVFNGLLPVVIIAVGVIIALGVATFIIYAVGGGFRRH